MLLATASILAVLAGSGTALAQPFQSFPSTGGQGGPSTQTGGQGGGFQQNGTNGQAGTTGGGGGGPGGTLGGAAGNGSGGGGGTGGAHGTTAATINAGNSTGANGGNATNAAATAGGGGGAGGYGYVLTAAGVFSTIGGQIFTGGIGGAGNGTTAGGSGGSGGGGLILLQGGTFTNVAGASLIGGGGGSTPITSNSFGHSGGDGLTTSNYIGTIFSATVTNAGTVTGGVGGTVIDAAGTPSTVSAQLANFGGNGISLVGGGSVTNTATGVVTGGVGGAGFTGTPAHTPGAAGYGGDGVVTSTGGTVTNSGQIAGGAGAAGTVAAAGSLPTASNLTFAGGIGGWGVILAGPANIPSSLVNNASGVISGGAGGVGGSSLAASPSPAAGTGGGGGAGVATFTNGSILNLGQILGGAGGVSANANAAGQSGGGVGGFAFGVGGTGILLNPTGPGNTMSVDNQGTIAGGSGATAGTSNGAPGAPGSRGGLGVDATANVSGLVTILNSGTIAGGNGTAGSTGTTTGAAGTGGVGIQMTGNGTITNSGVISGGLNGDGTRANAITFLSGVHTLTLQTGATFAGNVVVSNAANSANNTLNLDGAGTGNVSLPQFQNFGHLTQTSGAGGTWTLAGAGTITVDTTISAGTMLLAAGAVLTSPTVSVLTGGTLSLSTAALANDSLTINGGTLQVTDTTLNALGNAIALGANGGRFDIAAAANNFTVSQFFSGAGGLTKVGAGTLTLTAAHTYTGGTTISAGTLQLGNGGTIGSIAGNVTNNANLAFNHSNAFTFAGLISGTGAVQQNGTGTTTLTGANTYSGGTAINAGALAVASNANLGAAAGGLSFNGGSLSYLASFDMARATTLNAGGGTFDTNGFSSTLSGAIAGSGGLTKAGAGTLVLAGAGTYTGGTTISGGTLQIGSGGTAGAISGNVTNNANLAFNRSDGVTFGGTISGTGAVQQIGGGSTTFTANNTYTGGTTIASGALVLGNGGTTGAIVGNVANNGLFAVNRSNNLTLDGVISGTGSFQQFGSGTTIFTGDNTYTGGTLIGLGTLQLGNGGTSGSIAGNVTNNANLAFNHSNAFTFGGVISGSGAVQQTGSGNTTLTAASTYTGLTSINAGTLTVNGSLVSSVNINSGGTLMGAGTVGGVNANGGTVAPGNSVGTLNVNGNVTFGPGSTYLVEADAGQADKIAATGTATLSGGGVQLVSSSINGCGQANFTILTAGGGVSGTFAGLTSNVPFLSPTLTYTSNSVVLGLTGKSASFSSVAQTQNQRKVAAALDASPCSSALVQALSVLSAPQALAAFDQLSGEAHASTAGVLVDESSYMRTAVLGRLRQASYGGDTSMAALSLGGPQVAFQDEELATLLAYGKSPLPVKAPMVAPAVSRDVVFWAQGFGAWGKFNGDGNAAALKRDLAGFLTGFDARIGNGRAGIAAGYTASRNNIDGRGTSNVETGHLAAYGGWSFGALNLRAGGAYAWHAIDTDRNIVFPGFFDRANARYNGGTGQIFGEAGYGFAFGKVAVEPFAGAAWVHLRTDAFNETGGAAALAVAANTFEVGYSTLGVRAASLIPLADGMVLVPRASAAWQHALSDVTPTTTAAFLSTGTSFVMGGVPIARDSVLAEAGLDLHINRNVTLGVSYTGQLASNVQDHAAKGKFNWRF